jgi:hypothetical protein
MHILKVISASALTLLFSFGVVMAQADRLPGSTAYDHLSRAGTVTVTAFSSMPDAHADTEASIFGSDSDDDLLLLRKNVAASPAAMAALGVAGVTASDVVALKALPDGTVTLYVNDL